MEKEKKKRKSYYILTTILVIILIIFLYRCQDKQNGGNGTITQTSSVAIKDTITSSVVIDTLDTIKNDSEDVSSSVKSSSSKSSKKISYSSISSVVVDIVDTVTSSSSISSILTIPTAKDTIKPYVYVLPPGGLFSKPIKLEIKSLEQKTACFYKIGSGNYKKYSSKIDISSNSVFTFFGIDSAGNSSDTITYSYEFTNSSPCPDGMVYIKDKNYCVDQFEWPNKRGVKPVNFVSQYQAQDSCFSVGKHLCSFDELKNSANGKKYVYGDSYVMYKCNTKSGKIAKSSFYGECRSYYGVYDLIGNLSEWTSTPSGSDDTKYLVFGGNYSSGELANIYTGKFSYFPQNSYVSVGFRCCYDINKKE